MLVRAAPKEHFSWIVARAGCIPSPEAEGIEAVDSSGSVRGMVLYDCWTPNAVQAHMAVDMPIAWRSLLPSVFEYPFGQCGKGVILASIPGDNLKSIRTVAHLGFEPVSVIQDGFAVGVPLVLFQLRKENCRHIQKAAH